MGALSSIIVSAAPAGLPVGPCRSARPCQMALSHPYLQQEADDILPPYTRFPLRSGHTLKKAGQDRPAFPSGGVGALVRGELVHLHHCGGGGRAPHGGGGERG